MGRGREASMTKVKKKRNEIERRRTKKSTENGYGETQANAMHQEEYGKDI
jgi:hypothetical protein